ncbi:TssQ family T6SS-associated lipoprotein [Bordetella bronchiseptica]|uniref:TssQ family T6SS-associated lipoprotein n=1 Tax=Bordetella bronchiseptica TaxID=518 RepID=UPI00049F673C|nr:TssQ family T6SS-associated lipoprotein [Bordetella bronchiseptica]KDC69333.1 putative lipoprotein [Bordetella bronchiseptica MBORD632]
MTLRFHATLLGCAILLAGCASPTSERAGEPASDQAERDLQQIRQSYGAGAYGDVIRQVAHADALAQAPQSMRIEAWKLQAFSYCVTDHRVLCEAGFRRILQADPAFTLEPNEAGHPQWGPAYERARAAPAG